MARRQMRTKKKGKGLQLGWLKRITRRAQFPYVSSLPLSSSSSNSLFNPIFSSSWLSLSSSLDNFWLFSFSRTKSWNRIIINMISCCAEGGGNYPALYIFLRLLKNSLDKTLVSSRSAKILHQWQLSSELNWLVLFIGHLKLICRMLLLAFCLSHCTELLLPTLALCPPAEGGNVQARRHHPISAPHMDACRAGDTSRGSSHLSARTKSPASTGTHEEKQDFSSQVSWGIMAMLLPRDLVTRSIVNNALSFWHMVNYCPNFQKCNCIVV